MLRLLGYGSGSYVHSRSIVGRHAVGSCNGRLLLLLLLLLLPKPRCVRLRSRSVTGSWCSGAFHGVCWLLLMGVWVLSVARRWGLLVVVVRRRGRPSYPSSSYPSSLRGRWPVLELVLVLGRGRLLLLLLLLGLRLCLSPMSTSSLLLGGMLTILLLSRRWSGRLLIGILRCSLPRPLRLPLPLYLSLA